ncbi:PKD repeat-containing protein [Reichenbachiella faecimaris]|uniref:PKD repeat-containing protein n=1 Tax=Reichenbachiella faecimaris TaxID=692418 RepID=A0A1W2G723_REIFA|nr:PKD domain-containing protein [Reichenbachiella faecimaris]SMD32475.1 PKD repeat-containing protein [Reichenbachiella faecimaris]
MKQQNIKISKFIKVMNLLAGFALITGALFITSCVDETLPGAGSIADITPPSAGFSYSPDPTDQLMLVFTNQSESATDFTWDFGDGNTSDEENPSNTYPDFGTYTVTLVSTDKLGVSATTEIEVEVVEGPYQPFILEFGFEDLSLPDGTGDGRDSWRNSDLGGVIQITSSPVRSGEQAAKLTGSSSDQRIGYQLITVEAEANYDLNFYYTMLDNQTGWLTVSVLSGPVSTHAEAIAATIGSITVNNQDDPETYEAGTVSFNSGSSTEVAVYFFNGGSVESRLDDISIDIAAEGAVPPSASFSSEQSDAHYLSYTFTNASVNASSYAWDFGDGNTSTEESPSHAYAEADVYTVTLIATSEDGLTAEYSSEIEIHAPVTAAFTYEVDDADYKTYAFIDASEDAVSLLWEFGDGFQYTGMDPSHTYAEDGVYTVTLTATSVTGFEDVETVELTVALGFVVEVLNGTFDEYTSNTGDNADAWDMTPNSTVVNNDGETVDSPYDPLWDNGALDSWLETFYGDDSEQAGSSSDGNNGTRGAKLDETGRRLYQVVTVQAGETYTFSIDAMTTAAGITSEVFILNTEIEDETGINASTSDAAIDEYFAIPNIFATDGDAYATSTFDFTPSTNEIVIYVRNVDVVDGVAEAFFDNITITDAD